MKLTPPPLTRCFEDRIWYLADDVDTLLAATEIISRLSQPLPAPPRAEALAPHPQTAQLCADGHVWSHDYGDDWTPESGARCDCGKKGWGERVREIRLHTPEFDNHHNALLCPYCNPQKLVLRAAALDAAPSRSQHVDQALEALAFAEGAILDAIGLEDGLDGGAGEAVLKMIRAALIANGQQPITIPPEDEPGDPPYQTTEHRLAAALARSAPAETLEKVEDAAPRDTTDLDRLGEWAAIKARLQDHEIAGLTVYQQVETLLAAQSAKVDTP